MFLPLPLFRCGKKVERDGMFLPKSWPLDLDETFPWYLTGGGGDGEGSLDAAAVPLEDSSVQDSLLLMKSYALTSSIGAALCWTKQGSTLELLFELNPEETEIVDCGR